METWEIVSEVNLAARYGNLHELKKLLENGLPIDVLDRRGWSCLHEAANNGHFSSLQYLLQNFKNLNDKIDMKDHNGCTALFLASCHGNVASMQILLEHKADVNALNCEQRTPLYMSITLKNLEATKLLIKYKCDFDLKRTCDKCTALHLAVDGNWGKGLEMLLEARAFINCRERAGIEVINMAVSKGYDKVLEIFLRYSNVKDNTVNDEESSTYLVDKTAFNFSSLLFLASQRGHINCVRILLEAGADANKENSGHECAAQLPLHAAVEYNHTDCFKLLLRHTKMDALFGCSNNIFDLITGDTDRRIIGILIDLDVKKMYLACKPRKSFNILSKCSAPFVDFNAKVRFNELISITTRMVQCDNMSHVQYLLSRNFEINEKHAPNLFTPIHVAVCNRRMCVCCI